MSSLRGDAGDRTFFFMSTMLSEATEREREGGREAGWLCSVLGADPGEYSTVKPAKGIYPGA